MKKHKEIILALLVLFSVFTFNVSQSYASSLFDDLISLFSSNSEIQEQSSVINDHGLSNADEIIEKRTINSKTYKNNNGTYTAIIEPRPIHYKDSANNWRDINTFLVDSSDSAYEKESIKGIAKTRFPKAGGNADIVSIQAQGRSVSFRPVGFGKNKTLNLVAANTNGRSFNKNKAKYSNIYSDTDILYTIEPDGVKEEIILNKYTGANVFAFNVKASGLKINKESDGSLRFIDKESGEPVFNMPAPFSFDSGNEFDLGATTYEYEELGSSNYLVKVVVDDSWLSSDQRVYPVTIDPTIKTLQYGEIGINLGKDTSLHQAFPDTKYGSTGYLSVGEDGNSNDYRSLIQINPSNAIPTSASIVDARWGVYMYNQSSSTGVNITLDIINSLWWETGATWNNQPSYLYGPNYGIEEIKNVGGTYGWKEWDITSVYRSWHNGQRTNYGLMMFVNLNNFNIWKQFYSQEGQTKPRIIVKYSQTPSATNLSPGSSNFTNDSTPQLSWTFTDEDSADTQTKYRVQVFNTSDYTQAPVRDTLTVSNSVSNWTPSALSPDRRYWWRVKVYDSYEWSNWTATVFKLDTTGPNGSVLINNNDAYTNSTNVTLNLSASDPVLAGDNYAGSGLKEMRIQNPDGTTWPSSWTTLSSNSYSATTSYSLSPGDGTKTVRVQYRDDVGNISEYSDTITVETGSTLGIKDHWSYSDVGGLKVNLQNGNLITSNTDTSIPGRGPSLGLTRTYNSWSSNSDTTYGLKWSIGPAMQIEDSGGFVKLIESDASEYIYIPNADNTYKSPPGDFRNLVKTGTGSFTLTAKDQTVFTFTSSKLSSITDTNGNTLSITYNGSKIQKTTDSSARELNFNYDSNNRLQTIVDPANRTTTYAYDTLGRLESVTNPEYETTTYAYDSSDRLTGVTNPENATTQIAYLGGKVSQITVPTNPQGITKFTYGSGTTNVVDPLSFTTSYTINPTGQTTQITEPMGATPDPTTLEADFPNDTAVYNAATTAYIQFWNTLTNSVEKSLNQFQPVVNGTTITRSYDQYFQIIGEKDKDGSISRFEYDNRGNVLKEIDQVGLTTSYSYDARNNLLTTVSPTNETVTNIYDPITNNLLETIDAENNKTTRQYLANGDLEWEVSPKGNVSGANLDEFKTKYFYNAYGYATRVEQPPVKNPDGTTVQEITQSAYDIVGNKESDTAASGAITHYTYDKTGRLTQTRKPVNINGSDTITYVKTVSTYDKNGNKIKEETIDETTSQVVAKTEYTYNSAGQLLSEKIYNDVNNPSTTSVISYTYDAAGNKLTTTNPLAGTTTNQYDGLGRITKDAWSDNTFTAYKYDADSNLIKVGTNDGTRVTLISKADREIADGDAEKNVTKNIYDISSNRIKIGDPKNSTTSFEYTPNDNLEKTREPNATQTAFKYDEQGNETNVIYNNQSANKTVTTTSYNETDGTESLIDQANNKTEANYNSDGTIKSIKQPNNKNMAFEYYPSGSLRRQIATGSVQNSTNTLYRYNALGGTTFAETRNAQTNQIVAAATSSYDAQSRITSLRDLLDITVSFVYDLASNVSKITDSITGEAGSINYSYDTSSKLRTVSYKGNTATYLYDAAANNIGVELFSTVRTSLEYDSAKRVTNISNRNFSANNTYSSFTYSYDPNGNITAVKDTSTTTSYTYDVINRITDVKAGSNSTTSYQYDNLGNRLTKKDSSGTTSYSYDAANQLISYTKPGGESIISNYDENGNLITEQSSTQGTMQYSYDNQDNLVKVIKPNGDTIEFVYDSRGNRYSKTVTLSGGAAVSTYYQYDSAGNILLETDSNQNIKAKYIRDNTGKAIAMEQNNEMNYLIFNAHGDVTSIVDDSGATVATYTYDEFGNLTSSTGTIYNPLRYSGANNAYFDQETNLYKMGVRYYKPEIGRWITRDKYLGQQENPKTKNLYVYCLNNPVSMIDPSGYFANQLIDWAIKVSPNVQATLQRWAGEYILNPEYYNNWLTIAQEFPSFAKGRADSLWMKIMSPPVVGYGYTTRGKWVKAVQAHYLVNDQLAKYYTYSQRKNDKFVRTKILDGIFGNKTYQSVITFQKDWNFLFSLGLRKNAKNALKVDGVVGYNSWRALNW